MLGEEQQVVHRHVLLVREVRLALTRILVSKAPHPIHELEDERLITRCNILTCKPLASGQPRAFQISPPRYQVIEWCLRLFCEGAKVPRNADTAWEEIEDVDPTRGQEFEEAESYFKTLRIDEGQPEISAGKIRHYCRSNVMAIALAEINAS